ncbi:MAG: T9SS type A sorting domain-containing protein, partial [Ignavibacteriota bacterium]
GVDFGYLEISGDNTNWTTLNAFTGNSAGSWENRVYDIGILKNQSTGYIRFKTYTNAGTQQDGWHLDDVQVSDNNKTTAFPFFDNADVDTFSTNHWVAGSFGLKIANDHTGGGQVWALVPSGGTYNYLTLGGRMNLSSSTNPYLAFWVKKSDGGTGALSIEVSNDAGLTWAVLAQPSFNGTQYTWFEASLANFRQANVLVRIGCYAPYGSTYYIDDILIDNAPTPKPLTLLTPTNNGMKVKWGISTAPDFGNYRVVISTDANAVNPTGANMIFPAPGYSFHGETRVFDIFNMATIETTLTDLAFTNTQYYSKIYEIDTQGLINQGSDRVDLFTTFNTTAEVAPFLENFEGTYSWAADLPWAVTEFDASDPGHSTTHAYEDSPDGNYLPNSDRRLVMRINMNGVVHPVLRFNQKYTFEPGPDVGFIDYSIDNVNWITITGFTGNSSGLWESREFDAGYLKQATTGYVRFRSYSNGATQLDGWHLDDVEIFNNTKTQPVPIFDDVEVDSMSLKYWIPGVWSIKALNAHSGNQVWALSPAGGTYNYLTLNGTQNLSNAPNPFLDFFIKKADGGTGALSVEISGDAGLTWTALAQPSFNGANYTHYTYSLANYRQNNVVIRIGAYSPYGNTYLLDDITIGDSTGYTGVENLAGITPTEFELSQNYPNPFNPSTTIRYAVPNESKVSITVFNLLGQEVATLVNDIQPAGYHEVTFNAANLSSGVYLYRINAVSSINSKEFTSTKKFVLLK